MAMNANGELVPVKEYILEQTLSATSKSLDSYKERMTGLVHTHEDLQEACQQQEKDALEVIAALHRENEKREAKIKELRQQLDDEAKRHQDEVDEAAEEHDRKISDMSALVAEKEAACNVMQQEFSVIKDFRKKRHDLIKELEAQKQLMSDTERRHIETVARMERKFFEEKIRLQKEVNRKISELATKAHREAVANLKETEKEVFRQNVRISEALRHHVAESEALGKRNEELTRINARLVDEKGLHDVIVREKIVQAKTQAKEIKELRLKIQSMEHTLSHVVREFVHERTLMGEVASRELGSVRALAAALTASLERKTREMRYIKRLAQHVLDQRSDLEKFFLDALATIRDAIAAERLAAQKTQAAEYNRRLKAILTAKHGGAGTAGTPAASPAGAVVAMPDTNVAGTKDTTAATADIPTTAPNPNAKVEISELSWADKEKVMRLLFARMNGISLVGRNGGDYASEADGGGGEDTSADQSGQAETYGYEDRMVDIGDDWRGGGAEAGLGGGGGPIPVGGHWDD
ncbi:hypothetical protein HDU87_006516 [Geranomyces variabilis]|uniref:Basal body-orientation factor 1 n=1 Tax=Geranomyces variabilis TaxID=109894 RepID=A0AAD5THG8_9FUNG|nr:hypothetical protein HDU87_006516 [Geranomyces variabilis]